MPWIYPAQLTGAHSPKRELPCSLLAGLDNLKLPPIIARIRLGISAKPRRSQETDPPAGPMRTAVRRIWITDKTPPTACILPCMLVFLCMGHTCERERQIV